MDLQIIQSKIYEIRGCRVMLDSDLAALYQVETKALKQAVKRNIDRFPEDFMFELTKEETESLRSQIMTAERGTEDETNLRSQFVTSRWGGSRYQNFVFTEQGVAMISSVLRSDTAVKVNISIMRAFVLMRQMSIGYEELLRRIEELEQSKRGIYGGAIGYLDFAGNLDTCIAIRLVYKKNGEICIRSGAGIVADSVPENEFQECCNKARAVVQAIETAQEGLE